MSDVLLRVGIILYLAVFALLARIFVEDTLWLLHRRRSREPGLNTLADAEQFVEVLREPVTPLEHNEPVWTSRPPRTRATPFVLGLKAPVAMVRSVEPVFTGAGTPIFDELVRDIAVRKRALRMPTLEVRAQFDLIAARWECSHCAEGDCASCPGCSCSCRLVAA